MKTNPLLNWKWWVMLPPNLFFLLVGIFWAGIGATLKATIIVASLLDDAIEIADEWCSDSVIRPANRWTRAGRSTGGDDA